MKRVPVKKFKKKKDPMRMKTIKKPD